MHGLIQVLPQLTDEETHSEVQSQPQVTSLEPEPKKKKKNPIIEKYNLLGLAKTRKGLRVPSVSIPMTLKPQAPKHLVLSLRNKGCLPSSNGLQPRFGGKRGASQGPCFFSRPFLHLGVGKPSHRAAPSCLGQPRLCDPADASPRVSRSPTTFPNTVHCDFWGSKHFCLHGSHPRFKNLL